MFLRRLLRVAFFVEVGLLLVVLPWSGFWERNYFAQAWPAIGTLIRNHFARGAISGLGLVNLLAGFAELVPIFGAWTGGDVPMSDEVDRQARP